MLTCQSHPLQRFQRCRLACCPGQTHARTFHQVGVARGGANLITASYKKEQWTYLKENVSFLLLTTPEASERGTVMENEDTPSSPSATSHCCGMKYGCLGMWPAREIHGIRLWHWQIKLYVSCEWKASLPSCHTNGIASIYVARTQPYSSTRTLSSSHGNYSRLSYYL